LFLCRDLVFLNLFMALPLILLARLRLPLSFLNYPLVLDWMQIHGIF
jgi:hypothetical protein